jgi:hypothetical protein
MYSFSAARLSAYPVLLSLLSGCAGSFSDATTQTYRALPENFAIAARSSGSSRTAQLYGNDWVYSSQPSGDALVIYNRKRHSLALSYVETLSMDVAQPQGMMATADGLWYVANSGDSNVLVYQTTRSGPAGPVATLNDAGETPVNVAAAPSRDIVAVSNGSANGGGAGSLTLYLHNGTNPARVLTYGSDPIQGMGVAIDRHRNCYWSFNDPYSHTGAIVEFTGCNGTGTLVISGIINAGGIAFDQNDNLYYVDQATGIYKCGGASECTLFATGFGDPANINFDHRYQNLWVADASGYIDAIDLVTGEIEYSLEGVGGPSDPPIGVAPAPGS